MADNILYSIVTITDLYMRPAKGKRVKSFQVAAKKSTLRYGNPESLPEEETVENFNDVYYQLQYEVDWGVKKLYVYFTPTICTGDENPESFTTEEQFVKLVKRYEICEEVDSDFSNEQLVKELSRRELLAYIKDNLEDAE